MRVMSVCGWWGGEGGGECYMPVVMILRLVLTLCLHKSVKSPKLVGSDLLSSLFISLSHSYLYTRLDVCSAFHESLRTWFFFFGLLFFVWWFYLLSVIRLSIWGITYFYRMELVKQVRCHVYPNTREQRIFPWNLDKQPERTCRSHFGNTFQLFAIILSNACFQERTV